MKKTMNGQLRPKGKYFVHLQINGSAGNRDYGFAKTYELENENLWKEIDKIEPRPLHSLAGTEQRYFPVTLTINDDNSIPEIEIECPNGIAFLIEDYELFQYIKEFGSVIEKYEEDEYKLIEINEDSSIEPSITVTNKDNEIKITITIKIDK